MASNWQEVLFSAVGQVYLNIINFLPSMLAAIIVFIAGIVLARIAKGLTVKILSSLRVGLFFEKIGLDQFLEKAEVRIKIEEICGNIIKWLIIFVFFISTVNILGLYSVSAVLARVLAYIPTILSAAFILTGGVLLAGVVESLVKGAVGQVDVKVGRVTGKFASWLVVIFAILAAINELGIAQSLINILFIGIVAMMAIGFGLAIGLGAKDVVGQIFTNWYEDMKKQMKKK